LAHTTLRDSEEWQDREDEFRLLEKEEQQRLVQEYEDKMQGDLGSPQTLQDAFRASGKCNKDRELKNASAERLKTRDPRDISSSPGTRAGAHHGRLRRCSEAQDQAIQRTGAMAAHRQGPTRQGQGKFAKHAF
jgi:hypothetical protein